MFQANNTSTELIARSIRKLNNKNKPSKPIIRNLHDHNLHNPTWLHQILSWSRSKKTGCDVSGTKSKRQRVKKATMKTKAITSISIKHFRNVQVLTVPLVRTLAMRALLTGFQVIISKCADIHNPQWYSP